MNENDRARIAFKTLNRIYPNIKVPLNSRNVFTLLISVLLSAQCTDVNVNNVTKDIYPKYYKPEHFVKLGQKKLIVNNVLILEIDNTGILLSKKFYDKNDMNEINFDQDVTGINYSKRSFIFNVLSSVRQKIDDPLGKKRIKK